MKKHVVTNPDLDCFGCGACMSVCPQEAISFQLNEEGFYEAAVDENSCINCGLCQKVCLKYTRTRLEEPEMAHQKLLGCVSTRTDVLARTTSGGVAYELSEWGIQNGYKVLGVVYDNRTSEARHVLVSQKKDLDGLRGSKYVQSNIVSGFSQLLEDAAKDPTQKYLCIGTPCQIYGIRNIVALKRLPNEFLLVDLFCHGVPSYLLWKSYLKIQTPQVGDVHTVQFRYKGNGWHQYTMNLQGEKASYTKVAYRDLFYRFFFDNVVLNRSCFDCPVRKKFMSSDIRLGDFLGKKYEQREDGVSAVLVATKKGRDVVDMLVKEGRIQVENVHDSTADCLQYQSTEKYPRKQLRDEVIRRLGRGEELESVLKWYFSLLPMTYRIRYFVKSSFSFLPLFLFIPIRRFLRQL